MSAPGGDADSRASIGEEEVRIWSDRVGRALIDAGDPTAEREILAEAILWWGDRSTAFLDQLVELAPDDPRFARWQATAEELFVDFVSGVSITDRVDEDERRAIWALERLDRPGQETVVRRLLAEHVLGLPEGHPRRDVDRAAAALRDVLAEYRASTDGEGELATLALQIEHELVGEEELEAAISRGEDLLVAMPEAEYGRRFRIAVMSLESLRTVAARDAGDADGQRRWATRNLAVVEQLLAAAPDDPSIVMQLGMARELLGELGPAAEAFERAAAALGPGRDALARHHAGRMRANLGDWPGAVTALAPVLDELAVAAVTELAWAADEDRGSFARVGSQLTRAHAELGDWDAAVAVLDRLRSLRARARRAWRASAAGRELLDLERGLWADERGVPVDTPVRPFDHLGDVDPRTALLEAYRQVRPRLAEADLVTPTPGAVAAVLRPGEAVLTFGLLDTATLAAVLTPGAEPAWTGRLDPSWPSRRWLDVFGGDDDGLAFVLGAPEARLDGAAALDRLLGAVDELVAGPLGGLVPEGAERLTVVPHGILHLIPYWAVARWRGRRVRAAPSLAQLVAARGGPVRPLAGRAVIAADPTGDLPGTRLEAALVEEHVARLGLTAEVVTGPAATEDTVGDAVAGAALFHFAGHGVGDVVDPALAALLMAPDPALVAGDGDPFAEGRGRLTERRLLDGRWVERWLEAGPTTTLWDHHVDGRLLTRAERWSAGDLLVDDRFAGCRLVVLSACSSAVGSLGLEVDESSGLPAALDLAGVDVVVATTWPVPDGLALVFTNLFYEALGRGRGQVDLGDLVDDVRCALRDMTLGEALERMDALRRRTADPVVRLSLEAYARRLRAGASDRPFGRPWAWSAFAVFGGTAIEVGGDP